MVNYDSDDQVPGVKLLEPTLPCRRRSQKTELPRPFMTQNYEDSRCHNHLVGRSETGGPVTVFIQPMEQGSVVSREKRRPTYYLHSQERVGGDGYRRPHRSLVSRVNIPFCTRYRRTLVSFQSRVFRTRHLFQIRRPSGVIVKE